MTYDLIIVACSSNSNLIKITQNCIDSAQKDISELNVIIVETFPLVHEYENCLILPYKGVFCYNRALNSGIEYSDADVLILANNDLVFYHGWSQIGLLMVANGFGSASALSQWHFKKGFAQGEFIYEGYNIETLVTGWCLFVLRETINKIGRLNEDFDFWYSDNMYAEQIRNAGIRHGLFCNIRVDHLTSATLKTLPARKQRKYSFDNVRKYREYAS
jgi:hypothetical protein